MKEKIVDTLDAAVADIPDGARIMFGGFGVDVMQIEAAARGRVQDAHQCSLCVAVADCESVHVC